jgi:hypothetical protein
MIELRSDLAELDLVDHALATELRAVSQELEEVAATEQYQSFGVLASGNSERMAERHRRLAERWESLIARVRRVSGFENFLLPPNFNKLRQAAIAGPVVIINISESRCDALIVHFDRPVQLVPLPDVTLSGMKTLAKDFLMGSQLDDRNKFEIRHLRPTLQTLWSTIICPVMDTLSAYVPTATKVADNSAMPRVWWCPAGPYRRGGGPDLSKLVVSSYTSTLGSLIRARARSLSSHQFVAVGQAETPGQISIPNASIEIALIRQKTTARDIPFTIYEGRDVNMDAVLSALKECAHVHFACHGHQDQDTPLDSALILQDGPLRLSAIASSRLPNADFAFLSACHGASGSDDIPDEAMHLAAGLQVAGFRSVIPHVGDGGQHGPKSHGGRLRPSYRSGSYLGGSLFFEGGGWVK